MASWNGSYEYVKCEPESDESQIEENNIFLNFDEDEEDTQAEADECEDDQFSTNKQTQDMYKTSLPKNTANRNKWAMNTWAKWATAKNNEHTNKIINKNLNAMTDVELNYCFSKFVLEIKKVDGSHYPPNSLISLMMGLQSHVKMAHKRSIDIWNGSAYEHFRSVLYPEVKRLTAMGLGSQTKQAEVISVEDEDTMWERMVLGDHNPRVLLNTLVYLIGKAFTLRSGEAHRALRYRPPQIRVSEDRNRMCIIYTEDDSKRNQCALIKYRKVQKKEITQFSDTSHPKRCLITIYQKYMSKCPVTGRDNAFYLQPLRSYEEDGMWYSKQPLGHNSLQKTIPTLCKSAGIHGYKTNLSLRQPAATQPFEAGVNEELTMDRIEYNSSIGVQPYKKTNDEQNRKVSEILNDEPAKSKRRRIATSNDSSSSGVWPPHRIVLEGYYYARCGRVSDDE